MPYCPECGDEFQGWVEVCPDCGKALVDRKPESASSKSKREAKSGEEPLVRVATAQNEPLAMMWKEILENEGIHSLIKSRDLRASMYTPSLVSQCEIYVLASKAKKAEEILSSLRED